MTSGAQIALTRLNKYKRRSAERMKRLVYPIIISKKDADGFHLVTVPDLYEYGTGTQGEDMADAMQMARDFIGSICTMLEDEGKALPEPTPYEKIRCATEDTVTMVDIDLDEYRRATDMRSVCRNVTLPGWLDFAATKSGANVSAVLQEALKKELGISEPRR